MNKWRNKMKAIWDKIRAPYLRWKLKREYRKRIKELQERDPFIYD